jgi:hypothetical protein
VVIIKTKAIKIKRRETFKKWVIEFTTKCVSRERKKEAAQNKRERERERESKERERERVKREKKETRK